MPKHTQHQWRFYTISAFEGGQTEASCSVGGGAAAFDLNVVQQTNLKTDDIYAILCSYFFY